MLRCGEDPDFAIKPEAPFVLPSRKCRRNVMSGVAVLVVAAGKGERVGGIVPKQYASLMGKPVLRWTLEALARQTDVTAIQVAIGPEQEALYADRSEERRVGKECRSR